MKRVRNILMVVLLLWLAIVATGCAAKFEVSSLDVSPGACLPGDTVTVSATVGNVGRAEGDYVAQLLVNGAAEQTQTLALGPGASQALSFTLLKSEPAGYVVQLGELTASLTVLGVSNLEVSPSEVEVGESVTVSADMWNPAESQAIYRYCLHCQGDVVEEKDITVAGGSTEKVTCTVCLEAPGMYDVELLGLLGSFKVLRPAEFEVVGLSVPEEVFSAESITVTADVTNTGEVEGNYTATLSMNGTDVATDTVTLAPGATETMSFTFSEEAPGEYTLQLGGVTGRLNVLPHVLFEDDFSDPASGWPTGSLKDREFDYEAGEYYILVKSRNWTAWAWPPYAGPFEDFTLEVDVRLVSAQGLSGCGLIFCMGEYADEFYAFLIGTDGTYVLSVFLDNEWVDLVPVEWSPSIKTGSDTNHLKVVRQGSQIELYCNGTHLATVTDDSFTQGDVGVIAANTVKPNARFAFDNFKVSEPY